MEQVVVMDHHDIFVRDRPIGPVRFQIGYGAKRWWWREQGRQAWEGPYLSYEDALDAVLTLEWREETASSREHVVIPSGRRHRR